MTTADANDLLDLVGSVDHPADMSARLQSIAFEALAQGITDTRIVSLLHILGWRDGFGVFAIAGTPRFTYEATSDTIRQAVSDLGGQHVLVGSTQGWCVALIAVQGAVTPQVTCTSVDATFDATAPLGLTPIRSDVQGASQVLRSVVNTLLVAPSVSPLPRPLHAEEVLPERALIGDGDAREELYTSVYRSLKSQGDDDPTLETVSTFLRSGGSLDVTAKELSVHPNTVRYRLKRAAETTGWDATASREAYVLKTAIIIGSIEEAQREQHPLGSDHR